MVETTDITHSRDELSRQWQIFYDLVSENARQATKKNPTLGKMVLVDYQKQQVLIYPVSTKEFRFDTLSSLGKKPSQNQGAKLEADASVVWYDRKKGINQSGIKEPW
jgi:hypothetical protein